jgi:hypothetical protein
LVTKGGKRTFERHHFTLGLAGCGTFQHAQLNQQDKAISSKNTTQSRNKNSHKAGHNGPLETLVVKDLTVTKL